MISIQYRPPEIIRWLFPDYQWSTVNGKVLLTFDDGPSECTSLVLDKLDEHKISALFFMTGRNIEKNRDMSRVIVERGHTHGCHGYEHKYLWWRSTVYLGRDLEKYLGASADAGMGKPEYFRPPFGSLLPGISGITKKSGMKLVMWDIMTFDYKNNPDIVKFAVKKFLRRDSIIVLHDKSVLKGIMPELLDFIADEVRSRGFEFGKPDECLK